MPYATGQVVLWSKLLDPALHGIETLRDPRVQKVAMANPAHAPYGKKVMEVLRYYQVEEAVKSRLVLGENIAQAATYAATGMADVGLIALALARSPALKTHGHYWLIPQQAYTLLQQSFVVLKGAAANPSATAFTTFITSTPAHAVLQAYGFQLPR